MKRKGFSIVEALVIVAVVCILAALLIPAFMAVSNIGKENPNIPTIKIECSDWKQTEAFIPYGLNFHDRSLAYTTVIIEGKRYLLIVRGGTAGGVAVVPIEQVPAEAKDE
jgi:hypothetical protein